MPTQGPSEPIQSRVVFGRSLRRLRMGAGLSQEALAERAGLHRTYLGSVERGERNIGLENIHALAQALGVDVRDLFEPSDNA